jgi:putative glutamine amidotransferase
MKTKLIGVTSRVLYEDKVRKQFVNERYLTALIKRGFNTIMLTLDNPNIEDILALCDGFVITGGHDIDPHYFGEDNHGESKECDPHLDELDKVVVLYALKHKLPLLGICRGHQAINIFLGGSLYQDIGNSHTSTKHLVTSTKNRMFDFPVEFETNSYHHQALKKTANDLEIIAVSKDNIIEAVIHKTLPIMAFQWHPEMVQDTTISQQIFDKFRDLVNN